MKKLFALSFFLFSFCFCIKAQPLYLHWTRFIGGEMADKIVHSVSTDDSSIIFVGLTSDTIGNCDIPLSQADSQASVPINLLVGKIDSNGQLAWVKVYGGSRRDEAFKVLQLGNGNILVLGSTFSYDGNVSGQRGASDIWLLCLDSQGTLLWQKTYGSSDSDIPISFIQTADNGFLIFGQSNGSDHDVPFHYGSFFDMDWLVIKTDGLGNLLWSKTIGGTGYEESSGSILEANEGYYLLASSSSFDHDCDDSSWHTVPHGDMDYYMVRLDTSGIVIWSRSYGGSEVDIINNAIWDGRDSNIVLTGITKSVDHMLQNDYNNFYFAIWTLKTDANGSILWAKRMGDTASENRAYNILTYQSAEYIMSGTCNAGYPDVLPGRVGSVDTRIFMFDSVGSIFYDRVFGGQMQEFHPNLIHFKSGYAVTGTTHSSVFFGSNNLNANHSSATDGYLCTLFDFPDPLTVTESRFENHMLKIYPNPAEHAVRVLLPRNQLDGVLRIADNSGRVVYSKRHKGNKEIVIDASNWTRGVYVVQWRNANGEVSNSKLVK